MTGKKYLILNADDFGISSEANRAIVELLQTGKLSSTSLMPNGIFYEDACALIKENKIRNIGVHLTLTCDEINAPLSPLTSGRTLIDKDGFLYKNGSCFSKNTSFKEIVTECEAQLRRIKDDLIEFTHIDNHMYTVFPGLRLKGAFAIFYAYYRLHIRKPRGIRIAKKCYEISNVFQIWSGRRINPILNIFSKKLKLVRPDYVYSFPYNIEKAPTVQAKKEFFEYMLSMMPDGVSEIHVHPWMESDNYTGICESRVQEYYMLKELDVIDLCKKYGIILTSYQEICK